MRRLFILGGMALWLVSCANSGNGVEYTDTSTGPNTTMEPTSDPRDTVELGIRAGSEITPPTPGGTISDTSRKMQ